MQGKTVIVTGATNGIGEVAARELARQGAQVVLISRSAERCQATIQQIQAQVKGAQVDYIAADLAALAGIHQAADAFLQRYSRLDVLVNNAGGVFNTRQLSPDGFEMTFALNHLSYFLLTHRLLATLKATAAAQGEARIVSVSSGAHVMPRAISFDDLQRTKKYSSFSVYAESKLMNVMFTYELAERLQGTQVTANVLHPGFVRTGFGRNNAGLFTAVMGLIQVFALTPEQGAATSIYLASSPAVKGVTGQYFDKQRAVASSAASHDRAAWKRLWQVSEALTGIAAPV